MVIKFEYNNTELIILGKLNNADSLEYNIQMELSLGKGYYELRKKSGNSIVYFNMELTAIQSSSTRDIFYTKYKERLLLEMRNDKLKDLGI